MGMISISSPLKNDWFTAVVNKPEEPALARIPVSGTCTDGSHGVIVKLFASGAKVATESATASGTSWQTSLVDIAVGTYRIEATCDDGKGGTDTAIVDPITVQK